MVSCTISDSTYQLVNVSNHGPHHPLIASTFVSSILKVAYGITIQEENDPLVDNIEIALMGAAEAGNPGAFLVDIFPVMKYIPSWFPGAGWKKKAAYWRHINEIVANDPWNLVKEQMVRVMWRLTVPHHHSYEEDRKTAQLYPLLPRL